MARGVVPALGRLRLLAVRDLAHHVRLLGAGHDAPALDPLARPVVDAVAPGLVELDAVRRVGREQRRRRPVEEPRDVVGARRVAAQDPVVAEAPELARLDVRLLGRLGDLVGVGQPGLRLVAAEVAEQREQAGVVDGDVRQERRSFSSSRPAIAPIGSRVARTSASSSGSRSTYRTGTVGSPRDRASATRAWPSTTNPVRRLTSTCWTQPTASSAPASASCCAFGWIRQFAGLARSWSGASSPEPVIRLRQPVVGAAATRLRGHRAAAEVRPCIVATTA